MGIGNCEPWQTFGETICNGPRVRHVQVVTSFMFMDKLIDTSSVYFWTVL